MRKLVILIAVVFIPAMLMAQLTQQWAATYNGTGSSKTDSAQALALDADGNVYVVGTSDVGAGAQADYVTIKYDPDGKMLWTAMYRGTSGGPDCARDIAVDASGVYVFGRSYTPTGYEYATVKYSTDGEELWVATYKTAQNATMEAAGLELDPAGNVLVTGSGPGPDGSLDYATVKYSSSGTKLWEMLYNGPGNHSTDNATAIAVDAWGNICVTGYTGTGYATVMYEPDGTLLGSATYNLQGAGAIARDVAPDGSGNFVVTGYRTDGGYLTIKYEPDGDQVWLASYGSGWDTQAEAIAVGTDGDVYVTGSGLDQSGWVYFTTVKYSSSGEEQWVVSHSFNRYGYGLDKAFDITVDASGNSYVTGSTMDDWWNKHFATVKYDPAGDSLWTRQGRGYGDPSAWDGARMIALDPSGDVVVTGLSNADCVTAKYSSSGDSLWVVTYNYPLASTDVGKKVAFDASGNAYVLGTSNGYGLLTIKYSRSGTEEWVRTFPGWGVAIAVDATGNAYVAGSAGQAFVTVKYSPAGEQLWVRYYYGPPWGCNWYACGIALDASGNVYVGGSGIDDMSEKYYLAAVKYNSAGEVQWSGAYLDPNSTWIVGTGVAVDGSGNACVCGYAEGEGYLTAKFSGGPTEVWARTYPGYAYGIAADHSGNAYVSGQRDGYCTTVKYSADGEECWARTYSSNGEAGAVVADASGSAYVASVRFGSGGYDYVTVKYSTDGDLVWERFYDGGSHDYATAIALAGNGNVYVTGYSKGTGGYNDYATVGYTPSGDLVGSARYDGPASMDDRALSVATGPGCRVCVTGQAVVVGHDYDVATVMYFPPAAGTDDVGVTKILEPSGVIDTLTETPKATVYNYGMVTSSFDVWCEIRDAATNTVVYLKSSTVTDLAPGENCDVPFADWVVPKHQDGRYYACAWTDLPGDIYVQNDTARGDFAVEAKQQGPPAWVPWSDVPSAPQNRVVQHGAAMATDPQGLYAYLLKGNNTCEFYRYDPAIGSWFPLDPIPERGRDNIPRNVKEGGTLAQIGGKFYATKGGNSLEFWEYDPAAEQGSRWTQKADVPAGSKGVSNGAGATGVKDGPYSFVYLLKASETFEFYWYSVSNNSWYVCADAPGDQNKKWAAGSCVSSDGVDTVYALKGEHNEFHAYVVSTDKWLPKPDLPVGPKNKQAKGGAAICYHLGNVYCIKGSNSQEFWVFDCNANAWAQGPDVTLGPRKTRVQDGGALVYCRNSRYLFATKGNCLEFWSYGQLSNFTTIQSGEVVALDGAVKEFSLVVSPSVTSSQARLRYAIPKAGNVGLKLYEVTGRCAVVLRDGWCEPGRYTANLSAKGLARGVYFLKLESDACNLTRKVVIE